MNTEPFIPSEANDTLHTGPKLRRLLASIGRRTIGLWQWPVEFISDAAAVVWQSCRPITWRRSIRTEFMRQCYQVGAQALPFILVSGIFVGFGIVAQSLHWHVYRSGA
jgi:phospholipid/cholesterol/gamma-HCH transport system permease protein